MANTTLLLLLLALGAGTCAMTTTTESTTETTTTDTTTTETTTTTTEMTTETTTTTTPMATTPNITVTSSNWTQPPPPTAFPSTSNTTSFQPNNATANSTMVPTPVSPATPYTNTTTNSSSLVPTFGTNSSTVAPTFATNTTNNSTMAPTFATNTTNSSTVAPTTATNTSNSSTTAPTFATNTTNKSTMAPTSDMDDGTKSSSTQAVPTHRTTVRAPTVAPGSSAGPSPSRATAVQLLRSIPLSFRILNRSFNESLRDPVSEQYQSLSRAVLAMFDRVYGSRQTYKGCSELRFSQGSVAVQSTLVFGHGNTIISSTAAEQQLRNSVDQDGFIMDLQLDDIRSNMEEMSPAPVPAVPDWAIALLVLVCILLLLSILTCLLLAICACRRKTRGKLDLFSTKDSYHPMSEYLQYQSHGRYVSPSSKPNPYSQVAGSNGAGTGTFTYTNPSATSDNL